MVCAWSLCRGVLQDALCDGGGIVCACVSYRFVCVYVLCSSVSLRFVWSVCLACIVLGSLCACVMCRLFGGHVCVAPGLLCAWCDEW